MSGKNFMSYGDADTILTEFSNDIKSRVSTKANQGLTAQQIANAKANIDIDKVPNVATNDQTPTFLEESTRTNIASGDKLSLIFGKIKKFFSDLKAVAFSGSYNDLSDTPDLSLKADKTDIDSVYSVMGQNGAKNLIPYPYYHTSKTTAGITVTDNGDGTLTFDGTSTSSAVIFRLTNNDTNIEIPLNKDKYILTWVDSSEHKRYFRIDIALVKSDGTTIVLNGEPGVINIDNTNGEYKGIYAVTVWSGNNQTVSNLTFKPMLRLVADTDSTYQPYAKTNKQLTDGKAELESVRDYVNEFGAKNLIPYPFYETTKTQNGITFTDNGDGTITVSGTASADATFDIRNIWSASDIVELLPNTIYAFSGCPVGGSSSTYLIQFVNEESNLSNKSWLDDIGAGGILTTTDVKRFVGSRILIKSGTAFSTPVTFKPMLRLASDINDDTYVQYAMTNKQLTEKKANSATTLAGYGITNAYTKTEVDTALSGKANTSDIPSALSDLTDDSTHRVVTDTEKSTWNGKSNFSGNYNDLSNKPTIPSKLSDLSADASHRTVTDTEKAAWNGAKTYVVEKCTGGTVKTVSAGSQTEYSVDITKSGYTPIGIVGSRLLYNNKVVLDGFYVSGNTAYICFRNYTSSSVEIQGVRVYVLYVKN